MHPKFRPSAAAAATMLGVALQLTQACEVASPGEATDFAGPSQSDRGDRGFGEGGDDTSGGGAATSSAGTGAESGAPITGSGVGAPTTGSGVAEGGGTSECTSELAFEHRVIDDSFTGENKALGDIDGDGAVDVIIGSSKLIWYAAPGYEPREVPGSGGWLATDMQAADVNGDGAVDVVTPDGNGIYWFENPRGGGGHVDDEWPKHLVGNHGRVVHELEVADLNADGRVDVVANPNLNVWIQGAEPSEWTKVELHSLADSEGLGIGRIDDDDRPDIAVRGNWIRTPADATIASGYERFEIDRAIPDSVSIKVADVDADGAADVAFAPKEGATGSIVWYSAGDPEGEWTPHEVGAAGNVHEFVVADMNRDGLNDIVFAEMHPSEEKRVGIFVREGDDFRLEILATTGSHNIVVGDVDADCDLDIAGSNWEAPPVEIWLNGTCSNATLGCAL